MTRGPAAASGFPRCRPRWLWLVLVLGLGWMPAMPAHAQGGTLEYAVKAAYLYKFLPFVDWPARAFAAPASPFDLCIAGDDPFRELLDAAVASQRVSDRRIVVRRLTIAERPTGCHILFVGSANPRAVTEALQAASGMPVLSVTDGAREPGAKGMVNFVVQANRVRFEIDDLAAAASGLAISSKLLNLALNVRPRE
jgi:hypothetical protein